MQLRRPPIISRLNEFLNVLLTKRRKRQSFSDSSTNLSPEPKKPKQCDASNSPRNEHIEEGDDVILSALDMRRSLRHDLCRPPAPGEMHGTAP